MDYSLPGSPVHGIFQERVLEWGAKAELLTAVELLLWWNTLLKNTKKYVQRIIICVKSKGRYMFQQHFQMLLERLWNDFGKNRGLSRRKWETSPHPKKKKRRGLGWEKTEDRVRRPGTQDGTLWNRRSTTFTLILNCLY